MDMWAEEMYSVLEKVKSARLEAIVFSFFDGMVFEKLDNFASLLFAGAHQSVRLPQNETL